VGVEIFRTCPDRPWGPPSLLYNEYRVFPGGKERPGRDADPLPPSSAVGHERVELYLYSPYGPYSLHRASVPALYLYLYFIQRLKPSFLQLDMMNAKALTLNLLAPTTVGARINP